ncbi:alpha-amylase [Marivirga lumbricoides]|uniref:Alpha-amylase n=1 Tax=Marivirga lumbricoides TaxID=1046115 RepID=A0ABQ1MRQ4_9BACT|nr:alpha-amylase [Marivirga lumbricoides]
MHNENQTLIQFFHWYYPVDGSLWNRLNAELENLKNLGITKIWIPPATKADGGSNSVGYDIYDLYDLGEFDQKGSIRTKYGTKEELLKAIENAHQLGIEVLADAVLNHKAGADEVETVTAVEVKPTDRNEILTEPYEIEAFTKFTFPGRQNKYSKFIWDRSCFSGVDYDNKNERSAIFSIRNPFGDDWEQVCSEENGNYDYLMYSDIEYRNPQVREEVKRWGEWMMEAQKIDGFRLDAVKHIPPDFLNDWIDYLREKKGPEVFFVGEYWENNIESLNHFMDCTEGRMNLFDAPLHYNFHIASTGGNQYDLRQIFDNSLTQINPTKSVTLVDNHDSQPLQALESPIENWFKPLAYALILLRVDGTPCIFYPDLYGAKYTDKGADGQDHEITLPKVEELEKLLSARQNYAYGDQYDYFDHDTCIGWTRLGIEEKEKSGLAVVISNGDSGSKAMEMGQDFAGKRFIDLMAKSKKEVVVNKSGWGEFLCEAGSVSVWVQV